MEKENWGSEAFFRNLFELHTAVQLIIDPETGRIIDANQAAANFYGWPKKQLLKMYIGDINTLSTEKLEQAMQKAQKRKQIQFEFQHRIADHSIKDVEVFSCDIDIKGKKLLHSIIHDISERKQAEETIKLNEARLESLLKINHHPANSIQELLDFALQEAITLTGSRIGYIYIYDESKKEFTLNSWSKEVMHQCKIIEPQTIYELDKTGIWGEAVRQRKPILVNDFNAFNRLKKGVPIGHAPLHRFLTIPVFINAQIIAVVGVANKITDYNESDIRQLNLMMDAVWQIVKRKETEVEIKQSEARLKRAELASKIGNWEIHLETKMVYASEGATKIYGFEKTQNKYAAIKKVPLLEYRKLLDDSMNNLIQNNQAYNIEFKIKRLGDGKILDIHSLASYDREKKILFGTIQDITERKKTEEKLIQEQLFNRTLIENLPGIFYLYRYPEIQLVHWNKNHENLFGLSSEDHKNLFGREWARPELKESLIQAMHKVVKNGFSQEEITLYKNDGAEISIIQTSVRFETKDQIYVMGIGIDNTENKHNLDALKESKLKLSELNATKDKFFSIIAHDLKSPFNSILGLSDLLVEQIHANYTEGIEEYASIIQNSAKRALDLLLNLLEWSRSQTGRMEFNPEYIDLGSIIDEVIGLLQEGAQQKTITISSKLPRRIIAYADKAMLSTILRNLISNAIKFTHPGGNVQINACKKQNEIVVNVIDDGVGISPEIIEKLFRLDENHSTLGTLNEKGTGLGLVLCKEFVKKHKGTIGVESNINPSATKNGSNFHFTIPCSEA